MALKQLAVELDVSPLGLTPDAMQRWNECVGQVREARRRWLQKKLLYQAVAELLDSFEIRSLNGQLSVQELKLYKRLERRWFEAHCTRPGVERVADPELGQELTRDLRDYLRDAMRCRLANLTRSGEGVEAVADRISSRAQLRDTLAAEIERKRRQRSRTWVEVMKRSEELNRLLHSVMENRRILQPKFDIIHAKLKTEELQMLAEKAECRHLETRVKLFSDSVVSRYREVKASLDREEERWNKEVEDLERALTKYRNSEDSEYKNIVQQYRQCSHELDNMKRVFESLN